MKAQKDADINTLQERHAAELGKARWELGDRLAGEEEHHKSEISLFEERLGNLRSRQESETRLYEKRLKELEREKVAEKGANEEELERRLGGRGEEQSRLEDRVAELQDALEESG